MANIKWPTNPSGTSNVGLGANDIRLAKKTLILGMSETCNFGDTINPIKMGAAKLQTAGAFPLFDDSDGTIIWEYQYKPILTSTDSRVYSWATLADGSSGTFMALTPGHIACHHIFVESAEADGPHAHHHTILEQFGETAPGALPTVTVTFPIEYAEKPMVFACTSTGSTNPSAGEAQLNNSAFVKEVTTKDAQLKVDYAYLPQGGSNVTVMWWAVGHVEEAI